MKNFSGKSDPTDYRLSRLRSLNLALSNFSKATDSVSKLGALRELKELNADPIEPKVSGHDIILGRSPEEEILVPKGTIVSIPSSSLNGNLSISARIRAGKTYIVMAILQQVVQFGVHFLAFERKKSFRPIAHEYDAIVVKPEDLKHNLLRPPKGVPFRSHLMRICNIFAGTQLLTFVSEHVLFEAIVGALPSFQRENAGRFMDVFQVRIILAEIIKKLGYKEQRMTNLVVGNADRWNGICTYLGDVYSELEGVEIYELLQESSVIVDCSELSNAMIAFLLFEFLSILILSRLCNGLTEQTAPLHVTVMDEFEDIVGQVNVMGYSMLTDHWRRDRESNLGKIIVNHGADFHQRYDGQTITTTLSTNTFFHLVGPMGNREELMKIGRRLAFEERHLDWLSGDGERRWVLASPNHPPICFVAEEIDLSASFNEQANLERRTELLAPYPSVPVPPARKEYALSAVFRREFDMPKTMNQVRADSENRLRANAIRFLELIKKNPLSSYSDLREKFNSVATAQAAKALCLKKGWLKEAGIIEGSRRPAMYFHVTEEGRSMMLEEGILKQGERLHRMKHSLWVVKSASIIEERLREMGYVCLPEEGDGLDLTIKEKSGTVMFAIEFNYSTPVGHELKLIQKSIEAGMPRVILIVLGFEEEKENSFRMTIPEGKIVAFRSELRSKFEEIETKVTIFTWEESLKWIP